MHLTPGGAEIRRQTNIELIRAGRVGELRRAELLEERDLVVGG